MAPKARGDRRGARVQDYSALHSGRAAVTPKASDVLPKTLAASAVSNSGMLLAFRCVDVVNLLFADVADATLTKGPTSGGRSGSKTKTASGRDTPVASAVAARTGSAIVGPCM